MVTAVLVLAILGDVFGAIGVALALIFGAAVLGLSQGVVGQGVAGGAFVALVALGVGITGTAFSRSRPRLAGGLLLLAAILGSLGTFAFVLGSTLYLVACILAFFVRPSSQLPAPDMLDRQVAVATPAARVAPPSQIGRLPRPGRRAAVGTLVTSLALVGIVIGATVLAPAEQRPVRTLLAAVQKGDDIAIANLLAPAARSGSATVDTGTVLTTTLGHSEIAFITADWLRTLGPMTGTTIAIDNLTVATSARSADAAVVHVRGLFVATHENAIVRALLQGFRHTFDADIALTQVNGEWYVAAAAPSLRPTPQPADSRPPSSPPASASAARRLAIGTYAAPASATLSSSGWRLTLRDITVNLDESMLFEFDLTVGPTDGSWAGRESRVVLANGVWLNAIGSRSVFYDGGKGPGAVVRVALAFPAGLAGNQPYTLNVCGNLGFCWEPLAGPQLREY